MNKIINHFNKYKKSYYILFFIIFTFNFPVWTILWSIFMNISIKNIIFDSQTTQDNMDKNIEIIIPFLTDLLPILIAIISILYVYFSFTNISNTNTLKSYLKDLETLLIDVIKSNNNNFSFEKLKDKNKILYENIEDKGLASLIISLFLNYESCYNNYLEFTKKMKYLKLVIKFCFFLFIIILSILLFLLPLNFTLSIFLITVFIALTFFVIKYLNILDISDFNYYPKPSELLTPSFIIPRKSAKYLNIVNDLPIRLFAASTIISIEPFNPDNFSYNFKKTKINPQKITHYISLKNFLKFNIDNSSKHFITLQNYIEPKSISKEVKFSMVSQDVNDSFIKSIIFIFPNWIFDENNNIYKVVESHLSTAITSNNDKNLNLNLIMKNKFYQLNLFFDFKNKALCSFNYNHNISSDKYWSFRPTYASYLLSDNNKIIKNFNIEAADPKIFS